MRYQPLLPLLLVLVANPRVHAQVADTAMFPAWLAGHWCSHEAGSPGEEYWLSPSGGLMAGLSRTVVAGRRTRFEFLRIESAGDSLNYIAMPQANTGTVFARADGGRDWIRFENRAHDFPQRIEYRRAGDALRATISGPGDDGSDMEIPFEFRRCGG
jgi:hypothetical protein